MTIGSNQQCQSRRGAAVVSMVLAVLLIGLVLVGLVMSGAREQDLSLHRVNTLRAFYASEAGSAMALREIMLQTDEDGDAKIGHISNDGNPANDPALGTTRFSVISSNPTPEQMLITSTGTAGESWRKSAMALNILTGGFGFFMPFGSEQMAVADLQVATQIEIPQNAVLLSVSAYINGPSPKDARFGAYSDLLGEPGLLLAQSPREAVGGNSAHFQWVTLPLPSTPVSAGMYWLALSFENTSMEYGYDSSGGQTRYNTHRAVNDGYANPWGISTASSTRRINLFATAATQTTGMMNFSGASNYDNGDPQSTGTFRDLVNNAHISRGNDVSTNLVKFSAINFSAPGLTTRGVTLFDTTPATTAPTEFQGGIRVFADVLVTGVGANTNRRIGVAALVNQTAGQEGLALVLREGGGTDSLQLYRLPQNGDLTTATPITSSSNFNAAPDRWYRLVMDVILLGGNITVTGRIYQHSLEVNPNSSVNSEALKTLTYSNTVANLSGLQERGQVAICFDTNHAASGGSVTNFEIDSVLGTTTSAVITSWGEQQPY